MPTSVPVALQEHEWTEVLANVARRPMPGLAAWVFEHARVAGREHAVAAALVYDRQFGFTWADVDALYATLPFKMDASGERKLTRAMKPAELQRWQIAERIEALLPPRPKPST